ncbi:MAG: ATP-binding protein [Blastocatellia bacterium]
MELLKVLLVEDDEDDYLITRDLLAEIGGDRFVLDWAASYETGRVKMAGASYDVYLFDYRLGAHSGMELLRQTRANDDLTPIIMLTGQEEREVDIEAMRAGATDYLVKGRLDASVLERAIRYAIEEKRRAAERQQLQAARQAQAEAEAASRAKDEFVALVSHELRNPLNSILGWSRVLKQTDANPETIAKAAGIIERNALMQKQLIEDLIDLARVSSGKLRLEVSSLSLVQVIAEAMDVIQLSAEDKTIKISTRLDPSADAITGDPGRLRQVVWNLLSNSVKFTPPGGQIEVELRRADLFVEIQIRDTGQGITPEMLPHIFERYHQSDAASGQRRGGLGLGLALVRQLVEAHGGMVTATSKGKAQGATFTVKLPKQVPPTHSDVVS